MLNLGHTLRNLPAWVYFLVGAGLIGAGFWLTSLPLTSSFVAMSIPLMLTGLNVPFVLSVVTFGIAVWGVVLAWRALRRWRTESGSRLPLLSRLGFGLALACLSLIAARLPDAGLILTGWLFSLGLIAGGLLLWRYALVTHRAARPGSEASQGVGAEVPTDAGADAGVATPRRNQYLDPIHPRGDEQISTLPVARPGASRGQRVVAGVAALTLVVTAAGAVGALQVTQTQQIPEFYTAPDVTGLAPGTLLRSEPYLEDVPQGLQATRLLYVTQDHYGSPVAASAVLAVPEGAQDVPLITWAHGTVGVAQHCAPSLGDAALTPQAIPGVESFAEKGWAVVATDYPGMGVAGNMPYLVGKGQGQAVLDAARAAQRIDEVAWSGEVAVWGHSQGGHAALWAGQASPHYAPELNVVGTAALAPASRPYVMARDILDEPERLGSTLALSFVIEGYSRAYVTITVEDSVTPQGRVIVTEANKRCTSSGGTLVSALVGALISGDRTIVNRDFFEKQFAQLLRANETLGPWEAPLLIAQGTSDTVVPVTLNRAYSKLLCNAGQGHELREYDGQDHMGIVEPGGALNSDLLAWTGQLFDGEAPGGTNACA